MYYNPARGYFPKAQKISRKQAQKIAMRYSHKASLMIYAHTGDLDDELHRRHLVSMIADLFDAVPRGRGYCLGRAELKNLAHHIMFQKVKQKKAKRKAKRHVNA